jgi:hypothetical protein
VRADLCWWPHCCCRYQEEQEDQQDAGWLQGGKQRRQGSSGGVLGALVEAAAAAAEGRLLGELLAILPAEVRHLARSAQLAGSRGVVMASTDASDALAAVTK